MTLTPEMAEIKEKLDNLSKQMASEHQAYVKAKSLKLDKPVKSDEPTKSDEMIIAYRLDNRMKAMLSIAEIASKLSDSDLKKLGYSKKKIEHIVPPSVTAELGELKKKYIAAKEEGVKGAELTIISSQIKTITNRLGEQTASADAFTVMGLPSEKVISDDQKSKNRVAIPPTKLTVKFELDENGVNIYDTLDDNALLPSKYREAITSYKRDTRSSTPFNPITDTTYSEAWEKVRDAKEALAKATKEGRDTEPFEEALSTHKKTLATLQKQFNTRVTTMLNSEAKHIVNRMSEVKEGDDKGELLRLKFVSQVIDDTALRLDCYINRAMSEGIEKDRNVLLNNFMAQLAHSITKAGGIEFGGNFGRGISTTLEDALYTYEAKLLNGIQSMGDVEGGNGFDKETGRAKDSFDAKTTGHLSPAEKATADGTAVNLWKDSGSMFRALKKVGAEKGRGDKYLKDGDVIDRHENVVSFNGTQGLLYAYAYGISDGHIDLPLDDLPEARKVLRTGELFNNLKNEHPWDPNAMMDTLKEIGAYIPTRKERRNESNPLMDLLAEGKTYENNKDEFDAVIKDLGEDYEMYLAQSMRPVRYGKGDTDGDYSRSRFKFNDGGTVERIPDSFTDRGSVSAANNMRHILAMIEDFNDETTHGPTTEEFAREHTGQFEVPSEYTEIRADDELKDDDDFMDSIFKPGEKKHMANRQIYSYPKMWEGNHMLVNPGKIRDMIGKDVSGLGGTLGENVRTSKPYEYKEKNEEKKLDGPEVPEKVPKRSILQQREPKDNSSFDAYDSQNGEAAYNELTNDGRSLDDYYKSVGNKLITTDKDGKIKKIYTYDPKSKTFSIASEFLEGKDDMHRMAFSGYHHNNNNSDKYEYSSEHYTPGNPDSRFKLIMKPVTITTKDGSEKTVLSPIMMPVEKTLDGGFMPVEGVKGTYISSKDMRAYKDDVKHSVNRLNDARAYKASRDANFGADIDDALSDDPTKRNAWAQSIDKLIQSGKGDEVPPGARALFFSGEVDHDYLKNYPDNSANYEKAIKEFREGKHPDEFAEDIKLTATPLTRKESKQHRDEVKERHMQVEGTPAIEEEAPPVAEPKSKTKKKPAKANTSDKEKKPTEKKTQSTKTKEVKEPKVKTEVTVDDKNKTEPESSTKTETPETAKPSVDPSVKTEKVKKTGKVKKPISTSKSSTDKMSFTKSTEQPCVGTAKMGTGKDAIDMKPVKGKTSGDEGSKKTMKEIPSFKKMMQDKAESKFKKFGDCMNNEPEKADNSIAASADESFAESTPIDTPVDAPMGAPMGDAPVTTPVDAPMSDAPMGDAPMGPDAEVAPMESDLAETDEEAQPEELIPDETPQTPEELVSHWKEEGLDQNPELIQAALDQLKGESAPVEEDIAIEESIPEEEPKGHEDVPEKEDEPEKKEDKKDDEEPIKKSAPAIPSFKEMLARKH